MDSIWSISNMESNSPKARKPTPSLLRTSRPSTSKSNRPNSASPLNGPTSSRLRAQTWRSETLSPICTYPSTQRHQRQDRLRIGKDLIHLLQPSLAASKAKPCDPDLEGRVEAVLRYQDDHNWGGYRPELIENNRNGYWRGWAFWWYLIQY